MPRLPSALGLGGAKRTGGLDWTLNPPMRSDSPSVHRKKCGTPCGVCASIVPFVLCRLPRRAAGHVAVAEPVVGRRVSRGVT
eukprot:scaffold7938_cov129-Isochrysis_galbana.AAC.2